MGTEDNFYQIDHTGVDSSTLGVSIWTRDLDMRMSNFGALFYGDRNSDDYTRTLLDFESKDELVEEGAKRSSWNYAERDENPYIWGSTVKKTRDDQFIRMGMYKDNDADIDYPKFDVSDTNLVDAANMVSGKNYPSEGWRSFGGKYDFLPYSGGI
jgi:hypothetical protein